MTTSIFTDNSTTTGLETSTALGVTASTLDDNGKIDNKKQAIATTITTAPTTTASLNGAANDRNVKEIYNKYCSAYINSLSDEELTEALAQLDLLEKAKNNKKTKKTI